MVASTPVGLCFCRQPLAVSCLTTELPLPLVGAGDWCGGDNIEGAFASGLAAANWVNSKLQNLSLPGESFLRGI